MAPPPWERRSPDYLKNHVEQRTSWGFATTGFQLSPAKTGAGRLLSSALRSNCLDERPTPYS